MAAKQNMKKFTFLFILILLLSSASLAAANFFFQVSDTIFEGVTIGEIAVGGLSREAAAERIRDAYALAPDAAIVRLSCTEGSWQIRATEIDLQLDPQALAETAYQIGRSGSIATRLSDRYLAANNRRLLPLAVTYNKEKLIGKLNAIAQAVDRPAQNAIVFYKNDNVQIQKEETGYKLDVAAIEQKLAGLLRERIPPIEFELAAEAITPAIRQTDLQGIDARLACYATQYDASDYNRRTNVTIAAEKLKAVLLKPGAVFSFNELVGQRTVESGYLDAPVYIDGKLAVDIGGGVCQVSTTLYNAVLLADLDIEERSSHSRPPGYVPLGYDAAVADGLLDFKFKNNTEYPLYIAVTALAGQLKVDVYGAHKPPGRDVKIVAVDKKVIEPNVLIRQDATLDFGREIVEVEGAKGYSVALVRIVTQDGETVKKETLSRDEFAMEPKIVRVGTKAYKGKK